MDKTKEKQWKKQLKEAITDLETLKSLPFSENTDILNSIINKYPLFITPYYFSLINELDFNNDPIARQCFPDKRETLNSKWHTEDPLGEKGNMPFHYLIHRYHDRAVLLVTNRCAVHCRFCFRKRLWKTENENYDINDLELETACAYLADHMNIKEVLISGGDPLVLENDRLKEILFKLQEVPNIEILRLGTRIPAVLPMRIDKDLTDILSEISGLWVATHFNHPREITADAILACRQLLEKGIPMINQTVLLAEINNNAQVLEDLFRQLVKIGVKPQYLYHLDPAEGTSHFATGIKCGINILREFRSRLSSLATPTFAIDLPEGGGKVPLQAEYCDDDCNFEAIDGRKIRYFGADL